ncbi:hypothetical protein PSHT_11647 [Puccinia striiformis]|uniref:Uncharacterized protein n=1 Tax=Puccinia striiformis TaxID=27350 RepID=A0A2S4V261_9BASI|nr:hypothetical protein PSHT_11647 [Puccinia striiformis]
MPTRSVKNLACSTPNSTVPSIVVDDTPNTTIDDDSRETTPEAGDDDDDDTEELPVVIMNAHCGKSMKILVGFKIYVGTKNKKKTQTYLPINSSKNYPVILKLKTVFWWCSVPNVTEWDKSAKSQVWAVVIKEAASKKRKASLGGNSGGGDDGEGDSNNNFDGNGSESEINMDGCAKYRWRVQSTCCMIGSTRFTKILPTLRVHPSDLGRSRCKHGLLIWCVWPFFAYIQSGNWSADFTLS